MLCGGVRGSGSRAGTEVGGRGDSTARSMETGMSERVGPGVAGGQGTGEDTDLSLPTTFSFRNHPFPSRNPTEARPPTERCWWVWGAADLR